METIQSIDLIATNPDVRRGQPCLAGTGLRVIDVMMAHLFHDRSADDLASDYQLSLAQVHAAFSYYYAHKAALDEAIRQQIAQSQAYQEQQIGSTKPSLLSR